MERRNDHEAAVGGSASNNQDNNNIEIFLKRRDDWLEKKRGSLMVVASLLAAMAFQAGVNPPGGLWQDTPDKNATSSDTSSTGSEHRIKAGYSIMAYNNPVGYYRFIAFNTTGFVASLSIILLLTSGLPIKRRLFVWILMVILWVAITMMALSYLSSISSFTPNVEDKTFLSVIGTVTLVWIALMMILLLGHTVRGIVKMIKYVIKK